MNFTKTNVIVLLTWRRWPKPHSEVSLQGSCWCQHRVVRHPSSRPPCLPCCPPGLRQACTRYTTWHYCCLLLWFTSGHSHWTAVQCTWTDFNASQIKNHILYCVLSKLPNPAEFRPIEINSIHIQYMHVCIWKKHAVEIYTQEHTQKVTDRVGLTHVCAMYTEFYRLSYRNVNKRLHQSVRKHTSVLVKFYNWIKLLEL